MTGAQVHLQLRRFAGCPICNLHVREVARRYAEIENAGVTEVAVFHSSAERLRQYQAHLPFAVVADPERKLYKEFGVEWSLRSLLYLDAVRGAVRAIRHATSAVSR
jgi:peroxiredoxin